MEMHFILLKMFIHFILLKMFMVNLKYIFQIEMQR